MILIIGGGITGLAAACELADRHIPFRLLEASPRVGGLIRTEHVDGFTIEAGADSLLAQKPAGVEFCGKLGLTPRLISTSPPRTAFVLKGERLYRLPSPAVLGIPTTWRALAGYDLLPWPARARLAMERLVARRPAVDESAAAFFRRRFGPATVDLVAQPLLGGIHAGDVESLSMRSLFPRFTDVEARGQSIRRAFGAGRRTPGPEGLFRAPAAGMGEIVSAIERRVPQGSIVCDAAVETIRGTPGGWLVVARAAEHQARAVIAAAPAHAAAGFLAPIDGRVAELCADVPYVSTVSVAMAWPRASIRHALDGSGFVVARKYSSLRITACSWVSSKWTGRAPSGMVLLRAFLGGAHDTETIDLADERIVDLVRGELAGVLGIDDPPTLARVYRWRRAGAQHIVGHLERTAEIDARLSAHPGLFVAGSGFRSTGVPDCIADGVAAATAAAQYAKIP
jgi:oxygen-dependent protoporphyrinogen oxidase